MYRFFVLVSVGLFVFGLALFPPTLADARQAGAFPSLSAEGLLAEVNALRASNNFPPYRAHPVLMRIAQEHAEYIAAIGVMTQFDAAGRRPFQRALAAGYSVGGDLAAGGLFAELIHAGANLTPAQAVAFWRSDSAQRAIMLSSVFTDAGAGMASAGGVTYFVFDAGREAEALTPTATPLAPGMFIVSTAGARGTEAVIVMVSTPLDTGEVFHWVRKGEALWSIALAYQTTVDELKRLNRLASDAIFEGQKLLVREASTATPTFTQTPPGTATLGIPTSTATSAAAAALTFTPTATPFAPVPLESGWIAAGGIVFAALLAAGLGVLLSGRQKRPLSD